MQFNKPTSAKDLFICLFFFIMRRSQELIDKESNEIKTKYIN